MRRGKGRRRAARAALVLAILAIAFGATAEGIMHTNAVQDFIWTLAPRQ